MQISEFVQSGDVSFFAYTNGDLTEPPGYLGSSVYPQSLSQSFGTPTPQYQPDPEIPGKQNIVGYSYPLPELAQAQISQMWHRHSYTYLDRVRRLPCGQTWILRVGACERPDSLAEWESLVVVGELQMTDLEISDIKPTSGESNSVAWSGSFTATDFYFIFTARFSERADSVVLAEILDIIYADNVNCGSCAKISDGTQRIFALQAPNAGSAGLSAQLVYSLNGGSTWAAKDIATLGGRTANKLAASGKYIVVASEADGSHHYITKNSVASGSWTKVTSGYVAGRAPRCIYAATGSVTLFGAAGGYIYRSRNITTSVEVVDDGSSSTQNINAMHGIGSNFAIAVANNNVVKFSTNGGRGFQLLTTVDGLNGPESGANLTAVWAVTPYIWYVGTNTGKLWYTIDRGFTWAQRTLPNQDGISVIHDIKFSPKRSEHGVIALEYAGGGKVYRTVSGGREYADADPYIAGLPTNTRINAVALADVYAIAAGGLVSGNDGIIAIAEATE